MLIILLSYSFSSNETLGIRLMCLLQYEDKEIYNKELMFRP